jgi:hypothetical protein
LGRVGGQSAILPAQRLEHALTNVTKIGENAGFAGADRYSERFVNDGRIDLTRRMKSRF